MLSTDFRFGEVNDLAEQVKTDPEKVGFRNIFENKHGGASLLAFKKGQSLPRHIAPAEVMVSVLEGQIEFTMIDKAHVLGAGQFLLMGEAVPHQVLALTDAKVLLVKVKA